MRDRLRGQESADYDVEVHGITPETLEAILDSLGERLEMGRSFGIYGLRGEDIDVAMPRIEHATGRGHRDFQVFVDPFIGYEKAAKRRDFTVNAMMEDVLTGEVLDFYGGREDLQKLREGADGVVRGGRGRINSVGVEKAGGKSRVTPAVYIRGNGVADNEDFVRGEGDARFIAQAGKAGGEKSW